MASPHSVAEFRILQSFEAEQGNKLFEKALAACNKDMQDRWCNVANKVAVQDQPDYMATGSNSRLKRKWNADHEQKLM